MHILLTGASGALGQHLLHQVWKRNIPVTAWSGSQPFTLNGINCRPVDLSQSDSVLTAFAQARPTHVLHAAAMANMAECYRQADRAEVINVQGTRLLAQLCSEIGAKLLYVSTDLVFDGEQGNYTLSDAPAPTSVYGNTKRRGEEHASICDSHLIVRLSLLTGVPLSHRATPTFFQRMLAVLESNGSQASPMSLFVDEYRTPLDVGIAASALVELLLSAHTGLFHLGGPERLSRYDMGVALARFFGKDPRCFLAATRDDHPGPEPRPRDVSLDSSRWRSLFPNHSWPTFSESLVERAG